MRTPCCLKEGTNNKGAWSEQEDEKLIHYVTTHGEGSWRSLPKTAGLHRCGKSCRLRWINYLRPDVKRGNFAQDEEDLIVRLHALLGNRWSLIAGRLPGRTDNEVKDYWNSHLKSKLGIDPNNHRLISTGQRPRIISSSMPWSSSGEGSSLMAGIASTLADDEDAHEPLSSCAPADYQEYDTDSSTASATATALAASLT